MINCLMRLVFWPKSGSSSEEPSQSITQRVKGLWAQISSCLWSTPTPTGDLAPTPKEDLDFTNIYSGENQNLEGDLQRGKSLIYLENKDSQYVFLNALILRVNSKNNK